MNIGILEKDIDLSKINSEIDLIKRQIKIHRLGDCPQIGLQAPHANVNPLDWWSGSVGPVNHLKYPENYYKYTMWDTPYINRLIEKYGLVRTRIMTSAPKSCLTMHRDMTKRVHIPVITNPDCVMIINDAVHHLSSGSVYIADTTKKHTAINASREHRTHIVGCIY